MSLLRRITGLARRPATPPNMLAEEHVRLDRCEVLGDVSIGFRSYATLSLFRRIEVGRFCSIGRRCSLGAASHPLHGVTTHPFALPQDFKRSPSTRIGNDVWIGDNVLVLAGVNIGDGAVIGGGAVVTKDVAPYSVVGGVPAKKLRERFDRATTSALIDSEWWAFGDFVGGLATREPLEVVRLIRERDPPRLAPHFAPARADSW